MKEPEKIKRENAIYNSRRRLAYMIQLQEEYERKIRDLTYADKMVFQIYEELDNAFENAINKETKYLNSLL